MEYQNENKLKKILTILVFIIGGITFDYTLNFLLSKQSYYLISLLIGSITVGGIFILKKKIQLTNIQILSTILCILIFGLYIYHRSIPPYIKESFKTQFKIDETRYIGEFFANLSFAYGISQFAGGYLLTQFGIKMYPFLMGLGGASMLAMLYIPYFETISYLRFLTGFLISVGGIGLYNMLSKIIPKEYFNITASLSAFLGIKIAVVLCSISSIMFGAVPSWRAAISFNGISLIAIGFLSIFAFNYTTTNEIKSENNELSTKSSGIQDLLYFLTNRKLLSFFFISCFSVFLYYFGQGGLYDALLPKENLSPNLATNVLNQSYAYANLIIPFLLQLINYRVLLLGLTGIQVLGVFVMLFLAPGNLFGILFGVFSIGLGLCSHSLPQVITGEDYTGDRRAGFFLGLLNFAAMFLGCFTSQKLAAYLLKKSWIKSGSQMLNGVALYSVNHYTSILKIYFGISFMAFLLSLYIFKNNENNNNENENNNKI